MYQENDGTKKSDSYRTISNFNYENRVWLPRFDNGLLIAQTASQALKMFSAVNVPKGSLAEVIFAPL